MRQLALFSIISWLVSCESQPIYHPLFQEEHFVTVVKPYGHSNIRVPGMKPEFYKGLLLAMADNSYIYAVTDGLVTSVCASCERSLLGNHIIIAHEDGFEVTYYHLSEITVRAQTSISKGQKIAVSGNSGMTTVKNGLGIRVRSKGRSVNPQNWLRKTTPDLMPY